MENTGYVKTTEKGGLGIIEFYSPAHNSLPGNLLSDLTEQIQELGRRDSIGVILIKSAGDRTFCAGASFTELSSIQDYETGKKFFMGFANVINAMRVSSKIIIGRVQGKSVGGGVGLASAMDYCVGTKYAAVKLSELAVGIGPFVVGPAVHRKIGLAAFSELTIDSTSWKSAEWALSKGMYTHVFEDIEAMDSCLENFISGLLSKSKSALSEIKRILWEDCDHWGQLLEDRAEISGRLVLTQPAKTAIAAFLKK